jgi:cytochrome P450
MMTENSIFTAEQLWMPEFIANPYPTYQHLRKHTPLDHVFLPAGVVAGINEPLREWGLLNYHDVFNAFKDHETFVSGRNPLEGKLFPRLVLQRDDPPRHTRFRQLVNKPFTLKSVEKLIPLMTNLANELLDDIGSGETDIVKSYATPYPLNVIAHLMGIPGEELPIFKQLVDIMFDLTLSPQEREKGSQGLMRYFGELAAKRRICGGDDLITKLVEAEIDGESLEEWEIMGFCILLLLAGNETTARLIGNMLNILVDKPELWQQLRENRNLVEAMIEETLRYETPPQRIPRQTTREIEISGVKIPAGANISLFIGAANRDPTVFSNPDEFRLDREFCDHLAFGTGIHFCLGASLARAEAKIALNLLLDRFSVIQRGHQPAIKQTANLFVYGFEQLPLHLMA